MKKKTYNAPALTVVSFQSERGYAESSGTFGTPIPGLLELLMIERDVQYNETESFSAHSSWQENNNGFWN